MKAKAVITLIIGLVFQLAQILQGAVASPPCASNVVSCACCEGLDSCHCANSEEPDQKPAPLVPDSGNGLKLPAAKADETRITIESSGKTHPSPAVAASPVAGPLCGYAGVRLSVAFCSFVI